MRLPFIDPVNSPGIHSLQLLGAVSHCSQFQASALFKNTDRRINHVKHVFDGRAEPEHLEETHAGNAGENMQTPPR